MMRKIFTYNLVKNWAIVLFFFFGLGQLNAQIKQGAKDSSKQKMNMDAVYDRPFLAIKKSPVAIGGYLEANSIYSIDEGVSEGLSFQARRLTVFLSASISKRIKFLTELEIEEGGNKIAIEFAAMDIALSPLLNLRGGVVMNPIGAFNQNHDGPKWEFVERPNVSTQMLPATWSNVGFGLYGKTHKNKWVLGYELYLTNGFDNSVIDNDQGKTFLPSSKENPERFEESSNGKPLFTSKVAIKNRGIGEIGFSYMGGVYNQFEKDGIQLDKERRLDVFAVDINTKIKKTNTKIIGEYAQVLIDVPTTYTQNYGNKQQGFFVDVIQPIFTGTILDWDKAVLNLACRVDYVDWNVGSFNETKTNIGDEVFAITPAISFRPTSQTVLRLNYRYQWSKDILNYAAAKSSTITFGFSTYF